MMKTTAIKWKPADFKYFLTNPREACREEFEKRWKKETHIAQKGQMDLELPLKIDNDT